MRLQVFSSAQHRRASIVDSSVESEEELLERLLHPERVPEPPLADLDLGDLSLDEIERALAFYQIAPSTHARPGYPQLEEH